MTVTGMTRFSSSHTWVMPSLRPRIPFEAMSRFPLRASASGGGRTVRGVLYPADVICGRHALALWGRMRGDAPHANAPLGALSVPAERVSVVPRGPSHARRLRPARTSIDEP